VRIHTINPKSIKLGQLYGEFNRLTGEWTNGVLARVVRECSADPSPTNHWIVLDGPVDAIWIENMNTVLDDTKKLCLPNREVIGITPRMRMVFEVADLAVASPATVSRCGMVYLEPQALGWRPFLRSWLIQLPARLCPLRFAEKPADHARRVARMASILRGEGEPTEDTAPPGGVAAIDAAATAAAPAAAAPNAPPPLYQIKLMQLVDWLLEPMLAFVRDSCQETLTHEETGKVPGIPHMWGRPSTLCSLAPVCTSD